jgi:mRNA interferase RelE/StbE
VRYQVLYLTNAQKLLRQVEPEAMRDRIREHVNALACDPRPPGSEALHGDLQGLPKLRVGRYRIVYEVDDAERTVRVWTIRHRGNVYKRL